MADFTHLNHHRPFDKKNSFRQQYEDVLTVNPVASELELLLPSVVFASVRRSQFDDACGGATVVACVARSVFSASRERNDDTPLVALIIRFIISQL